MKILLGVAVNNRSENDLKLCLENIDNLIVPEGTEVFNYFILSNSENLISTLKSRSDFGIKIFSSRSNAKTTNCALIETFTTAIKELSKYLECDNVFFCDLDTAIGFKQNFLVEFISFANNTRRNLPEENSNSKNLIFKYSEPEEILAEDFKNGEIEDLDIINTVYDYVDIEEIHEKTHEKTHVFRETFFQGFIENGGIDYFPEVIFQGTIDDNDD